MFNRTLALLLVLCMVVISAVSCAPAQNTSTETTGASTEVTETEIKTETATETQTEIATEPETEAETETESEADVESEAESEFESETAFETVVETVTETATETEAVVETEADVESEIELDTEIESEADSEEESESEADSEEESETEAPNYLELPYSKTPGDLSICGVSIEEYVIVIPEVCDLYTLYAAMNLSEHLLKYGGITLDIVTDDVAEATYELVIGNTNRAGSAIAADVELEANEYILMMDDESVIIWGESYMVGGGAGAFATLYAAGAWRGYDIDITTIPTEATPTQFVFEEAKSAILLIGDGMGEKHIDMTLANGLDKFCARDMPNISWIVTRSQSVINGVEGVTDSAAAGTALATGFKTLNGAVGVDPDGNTLLNVRELAHSVGAKTAVLTTDEITGATPGAFLAHVASRGSTSMIQREVNNLLRRGKVDVAEGSLTDETFFSTAVSTLNTISTNDSSFFVMMEEGYIDKHSHNNDADNMMHTVERFNEVIAYCMEFVMFHPDTVLIVTADHETGGIRHNPYTNEFKFSSGGHTNVDVPIYAMGAGTEYFAETHENTRVPMFIASIFSDEAFGDPQYE